MHDFAGFPLSRPLGGSTDCRLEVLPLPDGRQTPLLRHVPATVSGPPVLYAHGIQSHPGWFVGSAQALARGGHEVFQVTRRGSGPAQADRGDAGGASQMLADVTAAVDYIKLQTGQQRPALVGVSWGGKLLTAWCLAGPRDIHSLTLVAPGIVSRVGVAAAAKLRIAAASVVKPGTLFDIPLNDVTLFTDNPAMREYLEHDRLRLHKAAARSLLGSAVLDRRIDRAGDGALTVPTTLILARRDRIIDNDGTRTVLERLSAGKVNVVTLDASHTIEFEPDISEFCQVLCHAVRRR
jgi:acylglycerol lipase